MTVIYVMTPCFVEPRAWQRMVSAIIDFRLQHRELNINISRSSDLGLCRMSTMVYVRKSQCHTDPFFEYKGGGRDVASRKLAWRLASCWLFIMPLPVASTSPSMSVLDLLLITYLQ